MIAVDLEMPDTGDPTIAYPRDAFPHRPVFVVVVPPGGGEEDARLFAVCVDWDSSSLRLGGAFHEGARPPAAPAQAYALDPLDPDAVPRLFERGGHPGDLLVAGADGDRDGRAAKAVLMFLDLSEGFSHSTKVSTAIEMRLSLAEAFSGLGGAWHRAADLLDPAALMRSGAVPVLGGNPLTAEGHHRLMLETSAAADAGMDVDRHPILDFRSLTRAELAHELRSDGRAAAYGVPDLDPRGPGADLLVRLIGRLADAVQADVDVEAGVEAARRGLDAALAAGEYPILRLASGSGPGAVCWRNLFAPSGLIGTACRRMADPSCDLPIVEAVAALPDWAQRAFRDPGAILRRRPRRIDHLEMILTDRHRPWFALPAKRISAAPAVAAALAALDAGRLETVLSETGRLVSALDAIPNSHPRASEARGALALGWRILARAAYERDLLAPDEIVNGDPGIPDLAVGLPYAGAFAMPTARRPIWRGPGM
ncbi:hypothetical protein [Methylobacterium fujisawaense]